ncbi:MAG: GNAT family N-acetyltransferase [Bacteroidota bacterium]
MNHSLPNLACQTIPQALVPSASRLIATSFYDNPAHIYLCPDDQTRLEQLTWLLGLNLQLQLKYQAESFCYPKNNTVQAMGFWTKPNEVVVGLGAKIKGGLYKVPFKMGWDGFKRTMEVSAGIDNHLQRTMGTKQPYRYLNNMVMEESLRGKGWGSQILQQQFDLIRQQNTKAVLALSTQRYWTVQFYERLGFEVLLEEKIGSGALAFVNWTMRKVLG